MLSAFTPLATFERTCRDVGLVPEGDIVCRLTELKNDAASEARVPAVTNAANHRGWYYNSRCDDNRRRGCDYDWTYRAKVAKGFSPPPVAFTSMSAYVRYWTRQAWDQSDVIAPVSFRSEREIAIVFGRKS